MRKILVVDDVPLIREPIEALLREEGYEARGASSGAEALIRLEAEVPDLVLLDLSMPTMDGLRVLDSIRRHPRLHATPVIILSSEEERSRVREAALLGISGYILKSRFSAAEFLTRISTQLARASGGSGGPSGGAIKVKGPEPPTEGRDARASAKPAATAPAVFHRVAVSPSPCPNRMGGFPDTLTALHALSPIVRRSEVTDRIAKGAELPGLSPVVGEVLRLTRSDRCSTESITGAIRQDSAIALKVLSLANSSVFSRGDTVDSLHKAVIRIGLERIRHTVVNVAVVDRFAAAAFNEYLDSASFWEHSIACGVLASEIARLVARGPSDAAFTAGLFHDVGRLVFAEMLAERYVEVLKAAHDSALPLEQVETRMLLVNHADVMDRLVRQWALPESLISPMLLHHLSARGIHAAAPAEMLQTYGLALANRLAHALLLGSSGNDTVYAIDDLCTALEIDGESLLTVINAAMRQTEEIRSGMICKPAASRPKRADQLRGLLAVPLKPLFIGQQEGTDAFRLFCEVLSGQCEAMEPNVAVMNIGRMADPSPLFAALERLEQERQLKGLPIILLSQIGRPLALPEMCRGRRWTHVATPFAVSRFISSFNELVSRS